MNSMCIYQTEGDYDFDEIDTPSLNLYEVIQTSGYLSKYEGCCGYAIYSQVHLDDIAKNTQVFKEVLEANEREEHGFGAIQCTVVSNILANELESNGWKLIFEHDNPGSGNTIYTYVLEL